MKYLSQLLIIIIFMMCRMPMDACDDCFCDPVETLSDSHCSEHGDCNGCQCSPFSSCSTCSGFIVSQPDNCDFTPSQIIIFDFFALDFYLTEAANNAGEDDFFYDPDLHLLEAGSAKINRLRGSPSFS